MLLTCFTDIYLDRFILLLRSFELFDVYLVNCIVFASSQYTWLNLEVIYVAIILKAFDAEVQIFSSVLCY